MGDILYCIFVCIGYEMRDILLDCIFVECICVDLVCPPAKKGRALATHNGDV